MGKKGRILHLIVQAIMLAFLLYFLEVGEEVLIYGADIALKFGVAVMSLVGAAISFILPDRRHRTLRDTQFGITAYLGKLTFILITMLLFVHGAAGSANALIHNQKLFDILSMGFLMLAAMFPLGHIGYLISTIKSAEFRNPKELIRQYYKRPKSR